MTKLWTPPGAQVVGAPAIPAGDIRLNDGRLLRRGPEFPLQHEGKPTGFKAVPFVSKDKMHVMASIDPTEKHGPLLHVSVSRPRTDPTWKDITLLKLAFFGERMNAMVLLGDNIYDHRLDLWQTPERWEIQ